jgi:hypothetical protein
MSPGNHEPFQQPMMFRARARAGLVLFTCGLSLVTAASSAGQESTDPTASARIRIGPVALNPTLALTNIGVDNNVFYDAAPLGPKQDFTVTVSPGTDLWVRLGRSLLSGTVKEDLVYYQKYASERSANNTYRANLLVPLNRLSMRFGVNYLNTRDRAGYDVDQRATRTELGYSGTVEIRALSKTFFGFRGDRNANTYDKKASYEGFNLDSELNHRLTAATLTVRHQLTPLTALTVDLGTDQDRFRYSPGRNADSKKIVAGVRFEPSALVAGTAVFGYRDYKPLDADVPPYKGTTASVDLASTLAGSLKVSVSATRDVQNSYDPDFPYYLQTGASGSLAVRVYGPVDLIGRLGTQRLDYRDRGGVADQRGIDHVETYGGGLGYRMSNTLRIGFNVDAQRRSSPIAKRDYRGVKLGMSVTYGT